jgi:catechol 2,3-dioxygenase-like lactoylglutathione lyase family enzyme
VLGKFLELSLVTQDIRASLDFYVSLGFSEVEVGEAWTHPYAVVTDGRLCLGLHQSDSFVPSVTFVRPDLLKHLDGLEQLGLSFEFRHLAGDVFNEVGWLDPSGHLLRMVEARTFSPGKRKATERSLCGYFSEIGLPTPNREAAKEHWERVGFIGMDEPDAPLPHVSCTSDSINIGLYDPAHVREPTLCFEVDDVKGALAKLAAAGVTPEVRLPTPLRYQPAALLTAPEGTRVLLTAPLD